ncbi:MAG: hypothetical protein MR330_04105 [Rikenellaceae bacterium]|nr:hypothetical protein [Rikenellaceae bacterium]
MKKSFLALTLSVLALGIAVSCQKENKEGIKPLELSSGETANCYIVSAEGKYSFPAVKGNSTESPGQISTAEVLWESFGNKVQPNAGDLISNVKYKDGKIVFTASAKKGNAVIAAKDAAGTILWSWHIWMTDKPEEQVYNNNAGIMMDRNLGATSATPEDISSYGLMYQWGRKDPFRGADDLTTKWEWNSSVIATTAQWPEALVSNKTTGTVEYSIAHPMTFIMENSHNSDWFYTDDYVTENTRWQAEKTIYDPCPPGWRVPDGGPFGVWAKAFGSTKAYIDSDGGWDTGDSGVDLSKTDVTLATGKTVWYPHEGLIYSNSSKLSGVSMMSGYWSVTTRSIYGYVFAVTKLDRGLMPYIDSPRAHGCSVRCMKIN